MAKNPRDTYNYVLKLGREHVYLGVTNNPELRLVQHEQLGKDFTHMVITGPRVTRATALKREEEALARYRRNQGRNPRFNKTKKG